MLGRKAALQWRVNIHGKAMRQCLGAESGKKAQGAPVQMWDWHLYTNSWDMYKHRGEFDSQRPGRDPAIFASEYAVVDDSGFGNLKVGSPACLCLWLEGGAVRTQTSMAGPKSLDDRQMQIRWPPIS